MTSGVPAFVSLHGRRAGLTPRGLIVDGRYPGETRPYGRDWFVNAKLGDNGRSGETFDESVATVATIFSSRSIRSGDRIYLVGKVREQISTPAGLFGVEVIGIGATRHADDHTEPSGGGYQGGSFSATWTAPASPTSATPLLTVRQQGWKFYNILFDGPSDAAAIQLLRDAGSGDDEDDASHAEFYGCKFVAGQNHIEFKGGLSQVILADNLFFGSTADSILETVGAGVGTNNYHRFLRNHWHNNESHIDMAMNYGSIIGNIFGKFTTDGISLTGGSENTVGGNYLYGTYSAAGGYDAGTNDEWGGNLNSLTGGVTAADPT